MDRNTTKDFEVLESSLNLTEIYNSKQLFTAVSKRYDRLVEKKKKTNTDHRLLKIFRNLQLLRKYHLLDEKEVSLLHDWIEDCKEKDFHRSIVAKYFTFDKSVIEAKIKYPDPPTPLLKILNFTELHDLYIFVSRNESSFKSFYDIITNLDEDYEETQRQKKFMVTERAKKRKQERAAQSSTEQRTKRRTPSGNGIESQAKFKSKSAEASKGVTKPSTKAAPSKSGKQKKLKALESEVISVDSDDEEDEIENSNHGESEQRIAEKCTYKNDASRENSRLPRSQNKERHVYVVDDDDDSDSDFKSYRPKFEKKQEDSSFASDTDSDSSMSSLF